MKKSILILYLSIHALFLFSQESRIVIVEHFTNSRCGVCASRNPAFYNLLDNYPDVIHIAFHPSSPYSSCIFSQHNPIQNDARTNFYGIYGATPRVVVQGEVIPPGSQLLTAAQLESKLGMMSDYAISFKHRFTIGDNIEVIATIKRVNGSGTEDLKFYGFLAEKLVEYNAPNGEDMHHDVFRKNALESIINLPNIGDSVVLTAQYLTDPVWDQDQMYVIGVLQRSSDKEILQSGQSGFAESTASVFQNKIAEVSDIIYPNPMIDHFSIRTDFREKINKAELYNLFGNKVKEIDINSSINISDLAAGYYFLVLTDKLGSNYTTKLVKQ